MTRIALLTVFLAGYLALLTPFTDYLRNKPVVEKLGYVPQPAVLKAVAADQRQTAASWLVMKVLLYFGSLVEAAKNEIILPPDYQAIQRNLEAAIELDPYNMDAYYFAQAILVWDAGRIDAVNRMLEHGMQYRKRNWSLPFYRGFNAAYFQHDYEQAAKYYQRAGELSGFGIFTRLAGRYLYETNRTDQAIAYLKVMAKNARKDAIRQSFQTRITALEGIRVIETAMSRFHEKRQRDAQSVQELLSSGFLAEIPLDPYGGKFFIDTSGKVRTTSKLAYGTQKQ